MAILDRSPGILYARSDGLLRRSIPIRSAVKAENCLLRRSIQEERRIANE